MITLIKLNYFGDQIAKKLHISPRDYRVFLDLRIVFMRRPLIKYFIVICSTDVNVIVNKDRLLDNTICDFSFEKLNDFHDSVFKASYNNKFQYIVCLYMSDNLNVMIDHCDAILYNNKYYFLDPIITFKNEALIIKYLNYSKDDMIDIYAFNRQYHQSNDENYHVDVVDDIPNHIEMGKFTYANITRKITNDQQDHELLFSSGDLLDTYKKDNNTYYDMYNHVSQIKIDNTYRIIFYHVDKLENIPKILKNEDKDHSIDSNFDIIFIETIVINHNESEIFNSRFNDIGSRYMYYNDITPSNNDYKQIKLLMFYNVHTLNRSNDVKCDEKKSNYSLLTEYMLTIKNKVINLIYFNPYKSVPIDNIIQGENFNNIKNIIVFGNFKHIFQMSNYDSYDKSILELLYAKYRDGRILSNRSIVDMLGVFDEEIFKDLDGMVSIGDDHHNDVQKLNVLYEIIINHFKSPPALGYYAIGNPELKSYVNLMQKILARRYIDIYTDNIIISSVIDDEDKQYYIDLKRTMDVILKYTESPYDHIGKNLKPSYTSWTARDTDRIFIGKDMENINIIDAGALYYNFSTHLPIYIDIQFK